ncbi:MAG: hypothetical protein HZA89_06825 [Verrucomicrobia bacterium]|nr:hypothetical protein [Verrucomicrobiota bacterium]
MKPVRFTFNLLFALVVFAGCSKPEPPAETKPVQKRLVLERTVTGQMFLGEDTNASIKLGGVVIRAVEHDIAELIISAAKREAKAMLDRTRTEIGEKNIARSKALERYMDAKKKADEAELNSIRLGLNSPAAQQSLAVLKTAAELARKENERCRDEADTAMKLSTNVAPLQVAFRSPWPSFSDATTDAEGNFKIKLPTTRPMILAATTSRKTGEREEVYYWMVSVPTNQMDGVLLNSATMAGK